MRQAILFIAVILCSCTQKQENKLSKEQTEKIKQDVQAVITQIRDAAANVDTTKLYDAFALDDKNFTYMEITGAYYDVNAYKQMVRDFYGPLKTEIIGKGEERFSYVSEDNVLWHYSGVLTAVSKNGQQSKYEPFGMSMLFKKYNDKWKVIFIQESTQELAKVDTQQ